MAEQNELQEVASYDLTAKMAPFLDRHLILHIYQFLQESKIFKKEAITRAELQLLETTSMIDYAIEKYEVLSETPSDEFVARRDEVMEELNGLQKNIMGVLQLLEDQERVAEIPSFKTTADLCARFDLGMAEIDSLKLYSKMQYETGNYELATELLKHYRSMMEKEGEGALNSTALVSSWWGHLASNILSAQYGNAVHLIYKLDKHFSEAKMSHKEILMQRAWLLHWSLFVIFCSQTDSKFTITADDTHEKFDLLVWFLSEKSLSIVSLACPHLFRYVGACLILYNKRLKYSMKDTVAILQHKVGSYSDPVTKFLLALNMDMDFDDAQKELMACNKVSKGDFFLSSHWTDFEENSRLLIFEMYCRIHQCINIDMLAGKLNMKSEEAELWIVKLIQNAKLDARIDSEKNRVVMSKAPPSVYQQVIEKTKNLSFRSTMLLSNLEKQEKENATGMGLRGN